MPIVLLPSFAGYPLGVLRHYGVSTIDQTLMDRNFISALVIQMAIPLCTLIVPAFVALFSIIANYYNQGIVNRLPCLPSYIYNAPILVLVEDITYHLTVIIVWLVVCFNGLIALLIYIYWNTAKLLKNHRMSPQTYQIHRIFMSALVIQLVIPFCTLIGPAIAVLTSIITNHYNQGIINFVILSITLHGSVTTVAMLIVHKPYRLAIKEMFQKFSLQSTEVARREMYANHVARMMSTTQ
ncbi:hypothetical protein GCK72_000147 [Caenorhabditis remanei]|uniref:Serpentine Receptor, class H n=1 Tax=Caenorhabditis remanei TaxID=31234 RepID=A0A6A5HLB3_CAERE|nr:hypothetical protein GCK72_000147 [Caenorhabditis remanei]KAF1768335.1 hypothetical protein GCK72_000147 [Caenorhabditis remanei]